MTTLITGSCVGTFTTKISRAGTVLALPTNFSGEIIISVASTSDERAHVEIFQRNFRLSNEIAYLVSNSFLECTDGSNEFYLCCVKLPSKFVH